MCAYEGNTIYRLRECIQEKNENEACKCNIYTCKKEEPLTTTHTLNQNATCLKNFVGPLIFGAHVVFFFILSIVVNSHVEIIWC